MDNIEVGGWAAAAGPENVIIVPVNGVCANILQMIEISVVWQPALTLIYILVEQAERGGGGVDCNI